MVLVLLAGLQLALLATAVLFWRRLQKLGAEVAELRAQLAGHGAGAALRRRAVGESPVRIVPVDEETPSLFPDLEQPPLERAARAWRLPGRSERSRATLSPETARGLALAVCATTPALGFFFGAGAGPIAAAAIVVAGAMMLVALRPMWRAAAWAGVITAAAWSAIALALGGAQATPIAFSSAITFAALAGLAHAHRRMPVPGAVMALAMGAAALALGSLIGLVSAAGVAFALIVAGAAIVGAINLRLEAIHLASFGAALIGLFVLSGQESAAIWFTPVTAWAGALYLAIAAVRVPQLGPRGLALAGTGVMSPLAAIVALHDSRHGLADNFAAAAVLVAAALAFAGVLAMAASRRQQGLSALKLTLWTLATGVFAAIAGAIYLAAPAPIAAPLFVATALALMALGTIWPDTVWRALAWVAGALAALNAAFAAHMLLTETPDWAPWILIAVGLALPALLAGVTASLAQRNQASATSGVFEALAFALGLASASLVLRTLASGGALLLAPIGFAEAGLHIAVWLIASLLLATRLTRGASSARRIMVHVLGGAALFTAAAAMLLWLTPFWTTRTPGEGASALLRFDGLGFLAPALLFWAHWVYWRAAGSELRTRLSLGSGALLMAAFVTLQVLQMRDHGVEGADFLGASIGAAAFALAIALNFAPGITNTAGRTRASYFEEDLHRYRRRQSRRQAR